jgi:hypothetical protein
MYGVAYAIAQCANQFNAVVIFRHLAQTSRGNNLLVTAKAKRSQGASREEFVDTPVRVSVVFSKVVERGSHVHEHDGRTLSGRDSRMMSQSQ